jgi:hypothetical protein
MGMGLLETIGSILIHPFKKLYYDLIDGSDLERCGCCKEITDERNSYNPFGGRSIVFHLMGCRRCNKRVCWKCLDEGKDSICLECRK